MSWVSKGRVITKECGADFAEAVRIYTLAVQANKQNATLGCANMSFAPSDKYADHRPAYKMSERTGKRFISKKTGQPVLLGKELILPRTYQDTMGALNRQGVWWCPFCVKLRRFERYDGFMSEGIEVNEPAMMCPVCNVSHNHGQVQRYNPICSRITHNGGLRRARSDKGVTRS